MNKILTFCFTLFIFLFAGCNWVFAQTYTNTFTKEGKTYVVTKTIQDGMITIETKVYDSEGRLLKTDVVEKAAQPTPVKELIYPSKTVTKVPIVTKAQESPSPTTKPATASMSPASVSVQSDLPVEVSSESGNLIVKLPSGDKEVLTSSEAVEKSAAEYGLDVIAEIKLVLEEKGLRYVISGTKKEKLLAVFEVYLPASYIFNPDNGGLERVEQTNLIKFADLLSF